MAVYLVFYFGIAALTLVYGYLKYIQSYWERKGFKSLPNPHFLFGHFKDTFLLKNNISVNLQNLYCSTTEPFIGIYSVLRPILLVRDPELVRNIFVRDFTHFTDHGSYMDEKSDPISAHLFAIPGEKWKNLRAQLSPTFSSGKIRAMFSTIVDCVKTVETYLEKAIKNDQIIDIRELAACMITNSIASVAFGIDVDSINNPNTDFRKYGRKIFESNYRNGLRGVFNITSPKLYRHSGLRTVDRDVEDFVFSMVRQNLKFREEDHVTRKDFFQLMVQLRNKGTVQLDDHWETEIRLDEKKWSVEEIAAQVFVFFIAGFSSPSLTMTFCMYELAKNAEIQAKVHEDIDRALNKYNGKITYESVSEMKYLDHCIDGKYEL